MRLLLVGVVFFSSMRIFNFILLFFENLERIEKSYTGWKVITFTKISPFPRTIPESDSTSKPKKVLIKLST